MVMVRARVRVRVFQRELVSFRLFLKFLFSCKGFKGVLQLCSSFQYLPLWLGLGCSREI